MVFTKSIKKLITQKQTFITTVKRTKSDIRDKIYEPCLRKKKRDEN